MRALYLRVFHVGIVTKKKQGHVPTHAWTMTRRILETTIPTSQKGNFPHSSHTHSNRKPNHSCSPRPPRSLCSMRSHFPPSSWPVHRCPFPTPSRSRLSLALPDSEATMPIIITFAVRRWFQDHGLASVNKVSEAPPHPVEIQAQQWARKPVRKLVRRLGA